MGFKIREGKAQFFLHDDGKGFLITCMLAESAEDCG